MISDEWKCVVVCFVSLCSVSAQSTHEPHDCKSSTLLYLVADHAETEHSDTKHTTTHFHSSLIMR